MPKLADRVKETTTSTGTGSVALGGAAAGYRAFSAAFTTGDSVYYTIENGTDWEVGIGTVTTGTPWTLARNTVLSSSNAGALVNFYAGTKNVFCTAPAASVLDVGNPSTSGTFTHSGDVVISGTGKRISGDFSNATTLNRVLFKTATVNDITRVGVIPNGTSTTALFETFNSSNPDNSAYVFLAATSSYVGVVSGKAGTLDYLPLRLNCNLTNIYLDPNTATFRPGFDATHTCGSGSFRWSTVYAATGTINTSDAREKTPVRPLTDSELAAAKQLSSEIGAFKFLSAIAEKGDAAREHIGMTVQRAIEIMTAHGLDPFGYGFICHDTWGDDFEYIDPVTEQRETKAAVVSEDGTVIQEAEFEAVVIEPGYQKKVRDAGDRYSFRTDELLMFIARGIKASMDDMDARISRLEAAAV